MRGLGLFADVVVISEREAQEWQKVRVSLIHSVLSDGRVVRGRMFSAEDRRGAGYAVDVTTGVPT